MKKRKFIWLYIFLAILAALAIFTAVWVRDVIGKAKTVLTRVDELRAEADTGLTKDSILNAIEISGELSTAIDDLNAEIDPVLPVIRGLEKLPRYGGYFANVEPMLDLASNLTNAVVILGQTGQPIIDKGFSSSDMDQLPAVYEFISSNQSNFDDAETYFRDAEVNWHQIDPEFIPGRFSGELSTVDEYMQLSSSMFDVLDVLPNLLGSDKPTNYLLLVQNKDELRPTGGFITGFGILQLNAGRIMVLRIDDSTTLNNVSEIREAPYPLKDLMFAHYLVPRDANWSPDFPTSAQATQEMYKISTQIETDIVIAFDQLFLVRLMEFIGPISTPDGMEEINAENFESKMIEYKQQNWIEGTTEQRKEYLSILAPILMAEVFKKSEISDLIELGKTALDEIQSGHLSINFKDPDAQKIVESYELDGAVRPGTGDFIMLVDSNIGFSKVDQYMKRSLDYRINLSDPVEPKGKLSINYYHTGNQDEQCFQGRSLIKDDIRPGDYYFSRCYWNYWRVLLQDNTQIKDIQFTEVPSEYFYEGVEWDQTPDIGEGVNNTTEAGALIVVPQSSEQTVEIEFQPPQTVLIENDEGVLTYLLRIQKENGIDYLPIEIQVTLPEGYVPIELNDSWIFDADENIVFWEGGIDRTTDFVLEFTDVN